MEQTEPKQPTEEQQKKRGQYRRILESKGLIPKQVRK